MSSFKLVKLILLTERLAHLQHSYPLTGVTINTAAAAIASSNLIRGECRQEEGRIFAE